MYIPVDCTLHSPGPHTIFGLYVSDVFWMVWRKTWAILFRLCVFSVGCSLLSNFLPHEARVMQLTKRLGWSRRYVCICYQVFVDLVAGWALNWRARLPSMDLEMMGFRPRRPQRHYGWYDKQPHC